jgi:hypothetical protein
MKEQELLGWKEVTIWKDFRPMYVSEAVWAEYIQHVSSKNFVRRLPSSTENQNWRVQGFFTTYIDRSILFVLHANRMVRFLFNYIHFLFVVFHK